MDITYPPAAEEFRTRVRAFLGEHLPADWAGLGALEEDEKETFREQWRRTLAANQMLAVSWPQEYGGAGLTLVEQVVLAEEFAKAGAPQGSENDGFGIGMLGNTLIHLGTEEQKKRYLPKILSGEQRWCQGYSEPDAGSDLAGLRTSAVLDGGEWVINGQKTWTSAGHLADHIFVLTRTDPDAPKHKGITFLLVPMDQPGVEVRPITNMAGYALFNEVFFTDARTASDEVVGGVNDGWRVAMALLGFERGVSATTDAIRFRAELDRLVAIARERGLTADPRIRDRLAWCHGRVEVMRFRGYQALTRSLAGQRPGPEAAISKITWSEYAQAYTELAMEILGPEALLMTGQPTGGLLQMPEHGTENTARSWVETFMSARAGTIYAGSSQVQRNIIGEQLLGLPKEPGWTPGRSASSRGAGPDMDFSYDDDQEQLRAGVRRFLAETSPVGKVREVGATELGYDASVWQRMAGELGLPGLHLPEEYGGAGTGLLEPAVVLEEMGRALSPSPYAAVLGASLAVLQLGTEEQRAELLPGMADGTVVATLALIEVASPTGTTALQTSAQSRGDQVTLTGSKTLVEHGVSADLLLVSATGSDGTRLYVVRGDAPGLTRTRVDGLDLTRPFAQVELAAVPAVPLGAAAGPEGQLDALLDVLTSLLAAEMVGGASACLEMATAYAKDRFQFNRPIGSFQAVKHRLAEMLVALDGARAAAQYAVFAADSDSPELTTVAPLAKAEASEAYTFAAGWNIQVHGGVGFTWEHDAHLYFRRAWSDSARYGVPAAQRARLADRLGL